MIQHIPPSLPADSHRAWLASLLLHRRNRLMPRFFDAYARLSGLGRRMRRRLGRRAAVTATGAALILAMAGGAFIAPTAHAATIIVDDGIVAINPDDGLCSLREAILNANGNNQFSSNPGECESGAVGPDTINLPANGVFTLTDSHNYAYYSDNGLPVISSEIIIEGNGSAIARDGTAPEFRVMVVDGDGDLTLNTVAISGGHSAEDGGGIYLYDGELTITDSLISYNHANDDGGGIEVDGTEDASTAVLTITNTQIAHNSAGELGGGLSQEEGGTVTLLDSIISHNDAVGSGAGIFSYYSELNLSNSTISDNTSTQTGGGLTTLGGVVQISGSTISNNTAHGIGGGGIWSGAYYTYISNSTISNNTTGSGGGGIYQAVGQLTLTHTTITGNATTYGSNGGGIYKGLFSGDLMISRSIVSGNTSDIKGKEIYIENGTVDSSHNVFGHSSLGTIEAVYGFTPGPTDVTAAVNGTDPTALADILNTTLADNGGPTLTHNLVAGSPALDMAPDADCATDPTNGLDQRGYARPFDVAGEGNDGDDTCDAGAVEFGSAPPSDDAAVFMSAKTSGVTADGVAFDNSDILMWDGAEWTKFFDGTDAHLDPSNKPKHNTNAFWIDGDEIVMSFAQNGRKVNGIGPKVDGMDLVKWDGNSFSLWFDGSDVGLTKKTPEKIDALHVLPGDASPIGGSCINYLLISTQGAGAVPAYGGGQIKFGGEDILGFCATNLGEATAGFWHMALDGSAVGLPKNAIDSISAGDDGNVIYFTTSKAVSLPGGVSGGHSMVYAYDQATGDFSGPLFIAADNGLGQKVDGLDKR